MRILVPIAHGSESLETVTLVNVLRRASIKVTLASIETETVINATRDIRLVADSPLSDIAGEDFDAIILPGGFSYGDYLRSGAIARFSPIMTEVAKFAGGGGPVSSALFLGGLPPNTLGRRGPDL